MLIVDEAAARAVAKSLGLSITGTIGILIEAYYRKMLSDDQIIDCVEGLRHTNRHISEKYMHKLLSLIYRH